MKFAGNMVRARIRQTYKPQKTASFPNRYLNLRHRDLVVSPAIISVVLAFGTANSSAAHGNARSDPCR
jgi:hypothetical protein